jgi:hypothetical protein
VSSPGGGFSGGGLMMDGLGGLVSGLGSLTRRGSKGACLPGKSVAFGGRVDRLSGPRSSGDVGGAGGGVECGD